MKFNRRMQTMKVPEWRDKYIDYKQLKDKIKEIKADALQVAVDYAKAHNASTGEKKTIRLQEMKGEVEFFEFIGNNAQRVADFYGVKEAEMLKQFHGLIAQAISMGFIKEYTPLRKEFKSRLERELARIATPLEVTLELDGGQKAPTREISKESIPFRRIVRKRSLTEQVQDGNRSKTTLAKIGSVLPKTWKRNRTVNGSENGVAIDQDGLEPKTVEINAMNDIEGSQAEREKGSSPQEEEDEESKSDFVESTDNESNFVSITNEKETNNKSRKSFQLDIQIEDQTIIVAPKRFIKKKKLRHAFVEFYRGLILLQSYCTVNSEAMTKILKKHDKNLGLVTREHYLRTQVDPMNWYNHSKLRLMITEMENVFSEAFTKGHRTKAMDKLRVPREQKSVAIANFWLGINVGLFLPLVGLMFYVGFTSGGSVNFPYLQSVIIAYRMIGMSILMVWLWGLDMYVWNRYHVNYIFIFGFNPRQHVRFQHILQAASVFTFLWGVSLSLYMISSIQPKGFEWLNIPWQIHPLILILSSAACVILYQVKSKWWLVRTIARIVSAPFVGVKFRDFFIADQLASIVIVLYDLEYTICFFVSDAWTGNNFCSAINPYTKPMIGILPGLWRFLQCLRRYRDDPEKAHLLNAGKYASSFPVVIFSSLRGRNASTTWLVLWLVSVIFSTSYTFLWDFMRDWSLQPCREKFPRERMLYPKRYYYFAVITNLLLRFTWALTISPDSISLILDPTIFAAILAGLEIVRRAQWNLFRLENEQLNNIGKFRAVNLQVPLPDSLIREFTVGSK